MSQNRGQKPSVEKPVPAAVQAELQRGLALHQQGKFAEAERTYQKILQRDPTNFAAQHLLGVVALQTRQMHRGVELIGKAIELNPNFAAAHFYLGYALSALKRPAEALASYDNALALEPDFTDAHINRGAVLSSLRRHDEALASYEKAIALKPNYAELYSNRGNTLNDLRRHLEALASYDKAIALKPDYAEAHNNRGNALNALQRYAEALASYDRAMALKSDNPDTHSNRGNALNALKRYEEALASCDRALVLKADFAEAHYNRGNALKALQRPEEALASYDKAIALKPDFAEARNNCGAALADLQRPKEALASYDEAIALKPHYAEAHYNRGNALKALQRPTEALASYDKAIALNPDNAMALHNRGNALCALNRYEEALASYDKVLALRPDFEFTSGSLLHTKMRICDWSNSQTHIAQLAQKIEHAEKVSSPFQMLAAIDSPDLQRKAAEIYALAKHPSNALPNLAKRQRNPKIRIGYFSADFFEHATAWLMAGLIERHDKTRFELIAFSFGPDKNDEMRQRLSAAFDQFIDVRDRSDKQVASLARQLQIDIAVDLKGYTEDARQNIFAFRAAPIQVNYLGYPGTMGADYIDYLIADQTLIPESNQRYFSERIVYLPHSYQVNDTKRRIAGRVFTRAEVRLPEDAFVFCCFNNNYKITPEVFDRWMRILRQAAGSVMWLLEDNKSAATNLRREAELRGVAGERLVFAPRMPIAEHLARHSLADLFLDTLPYNAHTTASDALWAGLPVLTQIGEAFAGRVAASLLNAIGLPQLVTKTPQSYETLATELAACPEKLAAIKHQLAHNRLTAPLFDTELFAKHIEAAFMVMYERHQAGLPPGHIHQS